MFDELKKGLHILACSGGPDSIALFSMLQEEGVSFTCCHVNYHLRADSEYDSDLVKTMCERFDVPYYRHDAHYTSGNVELWARKERYGFFVRTARALNAEAILIAHQEDDLLETYLMQKEKGLTPVCYGLAERSVYKGVPVIRPLLKMTRAEILAYCAEHELAYALDSTNSEDRYRRNQIRHQTVEKLSRKERDELLAEIRAKNEELTALRKGAAEYLAKGKDYDAEEFLQREDRKECLRQLVYPDLGEAYLEELLKQLSEKETVHLQVRDKLLDREYGKIRCTKKEEPFCYELKKQEYRSFPGFTLCVEGKTIEGVHILSEDLPLLLRSPKEGDKIRLRFGEKKLSRFFIDHKLPRQEREKTVVIENRAGSVIFVSGLGCDVNHYAIKPNTFVVKYENAKEDPMHKDIDRVLLSEEQIEKRCDELGKQIDNDYADKKPLLVGLLKGSVPFMAELMKHISLDIEIDFMDVSSYEGTESTGDVRIEKDLDSSPRDKDIILVEDIIDTGRTLKKVRDFLYGKGAASVKIVTLLNKQSRRVIDIQGDYVGFDVPNYFVVGYGLDFNQKYRNLPYVGVLKEELY